MSSFDFYTTQCDENKMSSDNENIYKISDESKTESPVHDVFGDSKWYEYGNRYSKDFEDNILHNKKFKHYRYKKNTFTYVEIKNINPILFDDSIVLKNKIEDEIDTEESCKDEIDTDESCKEEIYKDESCNEENDGEIDNEESCKEFDKEEKQLSLKRKLPVETCVKNQVQGKTSINNKKHKLRSCIHGKEAYRCKDCSFGVCKHGVKKLFCLTCKTYFCIHKKQKDKCNVCNLKKSIDTIKFVKKFNIASYDK